MNIGTLGWRCHSRLVLRGVATEWLRLPEPERTFKTLDMMIHEAYPYGARENHPYAMWLKERRRLLAEFGFAELKPNDVAEQERAELIARGQMELSI